MSPAIFPKLALVTFDTVHNARHVEEIGLETSSFEEKRFVERIRKTLNERDKIFDLNLSCFVFLGISGEKVLLLKKGSNFGQSSQF